MLDGEAFGLSTERSDLRGAALASAIKGIANVTQPVLGRSNPRTTN